MLSVLDLLDNAAMLSDTQVCFVPGDPAVSSAGELCRAAHVAAGWWRARTAPGESVGCVLTTSFDAIAVAYGAWLAGLRLVSLPYPGQGAAPGDYLSSLKLMCKIADVKLVMIDPVYVDLVPTTQGLSFERFNAYHGARALAAASTSTGSFVQFTSGTTSNPKGICLSLEALGAAVSSCIEALEPTEREVCVSWLPLSHDMGFIGICLAALAATAPPWNTRGSLVMIRPEEFLRNPMVWLRQCSDRAATFTAAPAFGLDIAARIMRASPPGSLDLSRMRAVITGAELISAATLRGFASAGSRHGLSELALCPAYGLAEASLGVTSVRPSAMWDTIRLDASSTSVSNPVASGESGVRIPSEVVSCGVPFQGTQVRIAGSRAVGEIEVSTPALMSNYLGDLPVPFSADGWLTTGDLGTLSNGNLYVIGRADDMLVVRGRNLCPEEIELAVASHGAVRSGSCVAVHDGDGGYAVLAEPHVSTLEAPCQGDLAEACRELRLMLVERYGIGPSRVVFVTPNTTPRTSSGKPRRNELARRLSDNDLSIEATG